MEVRGTDPKEEVMVTRRWIAAAVAACALPALVLAPTAASVATEPNVFAEVTGVVAKVNRTGGITVSGLVTCRAAVEKWESEHGEEAPEGVLNVGYSWVARQPLKRGAYAVAEFGSSHLTACYDTSSSAPAEQVYPWDSTPYGMTTPIYMYSQTGKFTKGPVYVQVTIEGGEVFPTPMPEPPEPLPYIEVFFQGGFEVVAQR